MKKFRTIFFVAVLLLATGTVALAKDYDVGKSPPTVEKFYTSDVSSDPAAQNILFASESCFDSAEAENCFLLPVFEFHPQYLLSAKHSGERPKFTNGERLRCEQQIKVCNNHSNKAGHILKE